MDRPKPPLPPLNAALRSLADESRQELSEHPSPEVLTAYHEGRLPAGDAERLQDHLALCHDCAELLLDLVAFLDPEPATGPSNLSDEEVGEAWQSMRSRLGGERPAEPPPLTVPTAPTLLRLPPPVPAPAPAPRPRGTAWTWALVASWLAVLGLGLWAAELRREVAGLSQPVVNAPLVELREDTTRGEPEKTQVLPATGGFLLLSAAGLPVHAGYEAEILEGEAGRVLWTGRGLKRDPAGENFSLYLPRGFLPPGSYRVRLYGVEAGKRQPLAEFPLQIGPA